MSELALFFSAFLGATIFPLSSEVTFLLALENGMDISSALFFASSGNILAICLNYWFGYWLYDKTKTKLNSSKLGKKSFAFGSKYGYFALAFSWLPIVGDPLTLVAGLVRLNFIWFVIIAGFIRFSRYYFLVFLI